MSDDLLLMIEIDPEGDIKAQIRTGAAIYQHRNGHWPGRVLIHPQTLAKDALSELGMSVHGLSMVQPHLIYLGEAV